MTNGEYNSRAAMIFQSQMVILRIAVFGLFEIGLRAEDILGGTMPSRADSAIAVATDRFSVAVIVFIGLQCMDLLTTLLAFSHGGVELNPVVRSLIPWTGRMMAVFASKIILISLILMYSRRKRVLYLGNIIYTAVVGWNVAIVLALRSQS